MDTQFEIIVNEKVSMRLLNESDAKAMFNCIDSNRNFFRKYLYWVDKTKSVSDSLLKIQEDIEDYKSGKSLELGVFYENHFVGRCGFHKIGKLNLEIGYFLHENMNGQGIMTQCVKTLTQYGFDVLKKHRVVIKMDVDNKASKAIPEKLGFTLEGIERESNLSCEGEWRNSFVYSFLSTDTFRM